jgi:serine phosphatase RsbU (regulator of sigma subunit)
MAWTRARSFRRSLIINLVLIVVAFGVIMAGVSYAASRFAARRASEALMTQVVDGLAEADDGFYRSVEKIFILADFWATRTWSGGFDTYEFDKTFPPLLLAFYEASSFYIALGSGDLYMISRDEGQWVSWTVRPIAWGDRAIVRSWSDDHPVPDERWVTLTFDVTELPWFKGALAKLPPAGTEAPLASRAFAAPPAVAPATGVPGRAISMVTRTQLGDPMVFCFERSLEGVTANLRQTRVLDGGRVAVLFGAPGVPPGLVYLGVPASPDLPDEAAADRLILDPVADLPGPIADFVASVVAQGGYDAGTPIRFASEGASWWGLAKRLDTTAFDLPSSPTWVTAVVPERDLLRRLPNMTLAVAGATALALLLALLRALTLARSYSRPIDQLVDQSRRMQRLDFDRPTEVATNVVEIGILASTIEGMRRALRSYATISEETRIAEAIVRGTLSAELPRPDGFEIEALRRPADETGGEVFDVAPRLGREREDTALMLLDPNGFGVEAAVLSAQLRAVFRAAVRAGTPLAEIARQLEHCLNHDLKDAGMVRAWLGFLDRDRARVDWLAAGLAANALHLTAAGEARVLATDARPLGGSATGGTFAAHSLTLERGDMLLVVSNGVIDALSKDRQRFGLERLRALIAARPGQAATAHLAAIDAEVAAFTGTAAIPADRTMLLVRRL